MCNRFVNSLAKIGHPQRRRIGYVDWLKVVDFFLDDNSVVEDFGFHALIIPWHLLLFIQFKILLMQKVLVLGNVDVVRADDVVAELVAGGDFVV